MHVLKFLSMVLYTSTIQYLFLALLVHVVRVRHVGLLNPGGYTELYINSISRTDLPYDTTQTYSLSEQTWLRTHFNGYTGGRLSVDMQ